MTEYESRVPVRQVTRGPRAHFFGYYEKTPWSPDGTRLLCQEVGFDGRMPTAEDAATVGVVELSSDGDGEPGFTPLAESRAWNWQQGCMLQWLPGSDSDVVFNDRAAGTDRFHAAVLDARTGALRRTLPRPVYAVAPDGRSALTLDFARLAACRPTTGYAAAAVPSSAAASPPRAAPENDGVWSMDMVTGDARMLFSFAEVSVVGANRAPDDAPQWFEHLMWNPDGTRFLFLHRWADGQTRRLRSRLFTAGADGSGLRCLCADGMASHFDWAGVAEIVAWARQEGAGDGWFVFADEEASGGDDGLRRGRRAEADLPPRDGHCSFSPDRTHLLSDAYPDHDGYSPLYVCPWPDGVRQDLGRFRQPAHLTGDVRCDLHPRWDRTGTRVCIDSAHADGVRQVYVLDVRSALGSAPPAG